MFKRLISAALVFGAAVLAPPVSAQQVCMPRDTLITSLETRFAETLGGGGLQTGTRLIELWRSRKSGTFTILLTRPDGMSCVLATGTHWHDESPRTKGVAG